MTEAYSEDDRNTPPIESRTTPVIIGEEVVVDDLSRPDPADVPVPEGLPE